MTIAPMTIAEAKFIAGMSPRVAMSRQSFAPPKAR
jgi:hypothetical protein